MAGYPLHNAEGKKDGEVTLDPKIFGVEVNPVVVQQAVRTQSANSRLPVAHAKGRSDVRGGGRKPWRQKGTGRARHGSIRSPLWKGGGVTFGPTSDRNYSLKMNKKARTKALRMALTDKAKDKKCVILKDLKIDSIKTSTLTKLLKKLPVKGTALIILPKKNNVIVKSARNAPDIGVILADSLNIRAVLQYDHLIFVQPSLDIVTDTYSR